MNSSVHPSRYFVIFLLMFIGCLVSFMTVSQAQSPSIEITHVPSCGTWEYLQGQVHNVAPADFHVATYLFLDGNGWWVKPTAASPCTTIQSDGTFSVPVVSGGYDLIAHRYAVVLIPIANSCPVALGTEYLPEELLSLPMAKAERNCYPLSFSGYTWIRRNSPYIGGPGNNCFDPAQVVVDGEGHLHLHLGASSSSCGSELRLNQSFGYGQYRIHTIGRVDTLDPQAILGIFTWDPDSKPAHTEMDIELGRWGVASDPLNAQFVLQPWGDPGNRRRFTISLSDSQNELTYYMKWYPASLEISVYHGHHFGVPPESDLIQRESFTTGVPAPTQERFHFNLWRLCGNTCSLSQDQEVIVTDFSYNPSPPTQFYTLTPCRVFDTRNDSGPDAGAPILAAHERRPFIITGKCGVPNDARAISANITAVNGGATGDLRVIAEHLASTDTSALSIPISRARANNATILLSTNGDGKIAVINDSPSSVHVILDVNGYFK